MPPSPEQLPLPITLNPRTSLDDYIPGQNQAALRALSELIVSGGYVYLWGGEATGKSHLLFGACSATFSRQGRAFYLPLKTAKQDIKSLDGLEHLDLVAIDDLDQVLGRAEWEEALFHLYNRIRDRGKALLVSASGPPAGLNIGLPDLRSRLAAGATLRLQPLDDGQREKVLMEGARRRGMILDRRLAQYLLRHYSRDLIQLTQLLDQLDKASLAKQHRLTIPFVKQFILGGLARLLTRSR